MTDKRHNELQDLLKEGISALRQMRQGIGNACVELRTLYGEKAGGDAGKAYGGSVAVKTKTEGTAPASAKSY